MPFLELNLAPAAEDMPDVAVRLVRAIIAAAGQDRDVMTVLLVHGKPAAVTAPCGDGPAWRPGSALTRRRLYRFRTRRRYCDLRFGRMSWLRQDRGLCPFACST